MKNLLSFLKTREKLGALVFYILAMAAVYSPVIFFGKSLQAPIYHPYSVTEEGIYGYEGRKPFGAFNVDVSNATITDYPVNKLAGDIYRSGRLPLWNPYKSIGQPLPEQLGQSVLFPYQILEDISPVGSWDFFLLGRLVIAGFFSFLFLRLLGVSQISALLGGLIYMFSGSFTWFINNEEMVNPAMMIPVVLWSIEKVFHRADFRSAAFLAVGLGLLLTAGSPGVVLYTILLAPAYVVFRIFAFSVSESLTNLIKTRLKLILIFMTTAVLGMSLAAPLLLPFFDFLKSAVALREALGSALVSAQHFGFVILPGLADIPVDYRFGISNGLWDAVGSYSGILPVYFALLGLIATFFYKSPLKKYLLFFLAFSIVILLKNYGAFPFILLGKLPLFQTVWSPRWSGPVWGWCLAMAAAVGGEVIREHRQQLSQKLKSLSGGLKFFSLVFLILGLGFYQKYVYDFLLEQKDKIVIIEGHSFLALGFYFGAVIAFLFLATWLLFYSKRNRASLLVLLGLVFLELWLWVPRGYQGITLKFVPFLFGAIAIVLAARRQRPWPLVLAGLFFVSFNLIDFFSPFGLPRRFDPFREPPYISFLKNQPGHFRSIGAGGVLMPNYASAFGISDIRHIDAITEKHFFNFKKDVLGVEEYPFWFINTPGSLAPADLISFPILCGERKYSPAKQKITFTDRLPYYSLLGVKYILVPKNFNLDEVFDVERPDKFPLVYNQEIKIYENPYVLPRTFVGQRFEAVSSYGQAQERLKTLELNEFKRLVFLEKEPGGHVNQTGASNTGIQAAIIKSYLPSKVVVEADINQPGILVLTDLFYPGWQATVNSEPAKIHRVDGLFRGIYLKSGRNQVILSYLPDKFKIGLALTGLAGAILILWFLAGRYPRGRVVFMPIIAVAVGFLIYQQWLTVANYLENKTLIHIDPNLATEADTQRKILWERRRREMNFVSQKLIQLLPALESKFLIDGFQFPEGLANPFQVDYRSSNGKKKRILIRVVKKDDPEYSYNPNIEPLVDFILKEHVESRRFIASSKFLSEKPIPLPIYLYKDIQEAGILRLLFFYWRKDDDILETRLYLTSAYYEFEEGRWKLVAGDEKLNSQLRFKERFHYDCDTATWKKIVSL